VEDFVPTETSARLHAVTANCEFLDVDENIKDSDAEFIDGRAGVTGPVSSSMQPCDAQSPAANTYGSAQSSMSTASADLR
jgi:hypothetical protein